MIGNREIKNGDRFVNNFERPFQQPIYKRRVIPSIEDTEINQNERRSHLCNFYKIYFDFVYYLGTCPFRIVRDERTGCYHANGWQPQKIFCAIFTILGFIHTISYVRSLLPESLKELDENNPVPYFNLLLCASHLLHHISAIKRFWLNKDGYVDVLNQIRKQKNLPVKLNMMTKPLFSYILYGFFTIKLALCACMIGGYDFIDPITSMSPSWWLRRSVTFARYAFVVGDKPKPDGVAPELSEINTWDWIMTVLSVIGQCHRAVLIYYCDLSMLAASLTLWATATAFASNIEDFMEEVDCLDIGLRKVGADDVSQILSGCGTKMQVGQGQVQKAWQTFYKSFKAIHTLSYVVNVSLGSSVTWYMCEGLMYYSTNVHKVILPINEVRRFVTLVFYLLTAANLYVSADTPYKLETLRAWLVKKENARNVPNDEANIVLHTINSADIGIRGSNLITITYPAVAGFLSLIVTFFIICLQQT